jgi:protein-tyrosine phosphatase
VPATVLFVCTGNWHRSPIAEHLLRARLAEHGVDDIAVRSAGTVARSGYGLPEETVAVLADRGIDGSEFRTTYLDEAALADVDVVIGAAREHRAAAVTLRPALLNRAFTLHELERICRTIDPGEITAEAPADRLRELARLAASRRTHTLPDDPTLDDLEDPIGQPMPAFVACAETVDAALGAVVPHVVVASGRD